MHAFSHVYIPPRSDPSIKQFIHPSAAAVIPISIHPPSSSRQFQPDLHQFAFVNCSQCRIKTVKVSKKVADFFFFLSEEGGRGGFKCQVPLGSDDGRYIYESIQPRGAEYFTCRSRLLHYHVHWSYSIYFKYSLFKIHANTQRAK